jgi:hypothetical protein
LPNKEAIFATATIWLIGPGESLSELMALVAALSLLAHIALIGVFSVQSAAKRLGWI